MELWFSNPILFPIGGCHSRQPGASRNHWELQIRGYWWVLVTFNITHFIHHLKYTRLVLATELTSSTHQKSNKNPI